MHTTSDRFLTAFADEWRASLATEREKLHAAFKENKPWSDYTLNYEGFFHRVCRRLSGEEELLTYSKEIYSIDAMFVGGKDLYRTGHCYPAELHVILEHENGPNVEEEMWKLLFWRCPLKVLVMYDWPESDVSGANLSNWATEKFAKLAEMHRDAVAFFPEPDFVRYLFIVGQVTKKNSIRWWQVSDLSGQAVPFIDK